MAMDSLPTVCSALDCSARRTQGPVCATHTSNVAPSHSSTLRSRRVKQPGGRRRLNSCGGALPRYATKARDTICNAVLIGAGVGKDVTASLNAAPLMNAAK